jgi:hypothetical protein
VVCHRPRVCGVEVLDVEEETHPPGSLSPDAGGLIFSVSPREQQACHGTWRADDYPCLGRPPFVRAGESSTSSKPSASTKKLMAGSYSLTRMAMRPRCIAPA